MSVQVRHHDSMLQQAIATELRLEVLDVSPASAALLTTITPVFYNVDSQVLCVGCCRTEVQSCVTRREDSGFRQPQAAFAWDGAAHLRSFDVL